jgi:hypothetical protein
MYTSLGGTGWLRQSQSRDLAQKCNAVPAVRDLCVSPCLNYTSTPHVDGCFVDRGINNAPHLGWNVECNAQATVGQVLVRSPAHAKGSGTFAQSAPAGCAPEFMLSLMAQPYLEKAPESTVSCSSVPPPAALPDHWKSRESIATRNVTFARGASARSTAAEFCAKSVPAKRRFFAGIPAKMRECFARTQVGDTRGPPPSNEKKNTSRH